MSKATSAATSLAAAAAAVGAESRAQTDEAAKVQVQPKAEPLAPASKPEAKAKPAPVAEPVKEAAPIAALLASEIKARESGVHFNTWEVVPKAGTPIENLLRPEFWGNVSQRLRPGDTLIVFPRDCVWYAELLCWDAGQNWAHVEIVMAKQRPQFQSVAGVAEDFEIARDPIDGWVVKRKYTGAKMKGNLASHEDARKWLLEHQKALRA